MRAEDSSMESIRLNARSIFTYLKGFAELRTQLIRDLEKYEDCLWLADIPRENDCKCAIWSWESDQEAGETWVEVKRPRLEEPPRPPEAILRWLVPEEWRSSATELPSLLEAIVEPPEREGEPARNLSLEDHPEVKAQWEEYVEGRWWAWRQKDLRSRPIFEAYSKLFAIHQQLTRLGEQFELVIAFGLLSGISPSGQRIRRHLLTTRASLQFEARRGVLSVRATSDGARLSLEEDMLDLQERPPREAAEAIATHLEETGESVWDLEAIRGALNTWAHSFSETCQVTDEITPPTELLRPASVFLAPALILRRRGERSWIAAFQEVARQIDAGAEIPAGLVRFAGGSRGREERPGGKGRSLPGDEEVYFPLPANDEQRQILRRLENSYGLLVQGPPGTGKSHTIVNLICHLLATGKRVLVTSHTQRALRVLKRYISERVPEISPLAVLQLGEGPEALQEMDESVQGITAKHHDWDADRAAARIRELEAQLGEARRGHVEALRALRQRRERETYPFDHVAGTYSGTLAAIAQRLQEERARLDWLPQYPAPDSVCPLSDDQYREVSEFVLNDELRELANAPWRAPEESALPSPDEVVELLRFLEADKARLGELAGAMEHPSYTKLLSIPGANRLQIKRELSVALIALRQLKSRRLDWVDNALRDAAAGQSARWAALFAATTEATGKLAGRCEWFDRTPARWPATTDLERIKNGAEELEAHFAQRRWRGLFGPLRPAVIRRNSHFRTEVSIGGRPCWGAESIALLREWLQIYETLNHLRRRWTGLLSERHTDAVTALAGYQDAMEALGRTIEIGDRLSRLRQGLHALLPVDQLDWTSPEELGALLAAFEAAAAAEAVSGREQQLRMLQLRVQPGEGRRPPSPAWTGLAEALATRDSVAYRKALAQARIEHAQMARVDQAEVQLRLLEETLPELSAALLRRQEDVLASRHPEGLQSAWSWAQAWVWLREQLDPAEEERHRIALDDATRRIGTALAALASEQAWFKCFERITDHERQHLVSWAHAVRKIGKGTGKYAARHREDARGHMKECRRAIPAWVMPLYRVAETVPPLPEIFDVAIIDEASQSGPEALLLTFLAKTVVVVGDDQQISPSFVGLNRESVQQLRAEHLRNVEHADQFGTESSFFVLADIQYPGRIFLREHFRCMPEIIGFSNQLSYKTSPLIPLRQFGGGRLMPVVTTERVANGTRKGTGQRVHNPEEAEAIVQWIQDAVRDPRYEGKSFGVISLLGDWQAREIERRLVGTLGPSVFGERQIVCGDAYAFQGDERDVVLLSMVVALSEEHSIGVLSKEEDRRRFNVAASRARDQMILFHSVDAADLSSKCFRYSLLSYCLSPWTEPLGLGDLEIDEVRSRALRSDRGRLRPPDPFESWFEVDVFLRLLDGGLTVRPQFRIHGYRIDLVVVTDRDKIAIECDGDHWHGPERYEADAGRQRELERCGWTFYRIPESAFRLDPEGALAGLWSLLKERENRRSKGPGPGTTTEDARSGLGPQPPGSSGPPDLLQGDEPNDGGGAEPDSEPFELDPPAPEVSLLPYQEWPQGSLPNPMKARLDDLIRGLVEIVKIEGPILGARLCRLAAQSGGFQRAGRQIRHQLHSAIARAEKRRELEVVRPVDSRLLDDAVIHLPGAPPVVIRDRGPRGFDEIPSSEVVALRDVVRAEAPFLSEEGLAREVIQRFGYRRTTTNMTNRIKELGKAHLLPREEPSSSGASEA